MLAQETTHASAHLCTASLAELLQSGRGSDTAVIVPGRSTLTYDRVRGEVLRLAHTLGHLGLGTRDAIAICLPNGPEALLSILGAALVARAAPLNPALTLSEMSSVFQDLDARALVIPPNAPESTRAAWAGRGPVLEVALDSKGRLALHTLTVGCLEYCNVEPRPSDVALVLQTSGTTGRAKRVPLRHRHLVASAYNIARSYALDATDVSMCVMPLFHVHGLIGSVLATLASGGRVVLPTRPSPIGFPESLTEHRATWYSAVPTFHQLVLASLRSGRSGARVPTLRFVRSASAPLGAGSLAALEGLFGVPVVEALGMTEAAHQVASNPLPPAHRKPGSVGLGTGVQVAVADETGAGLPPGEVGEVIIRGPNVIDAYDAEAEVNALAFTADGWFRTGDVGTLDADGYLTLVGRIKELINRGGEKIAPAEVEEVLLSHPAVADVACVGVPHPRWGEEVAMAVVPRQPVSQAELVAHCRRHLAEFKVPKHFALVDAIPRSPTGKIRRQHVVKLMEARA
jgi:acyl-CoA synthetase (AMP-forming)/AMP-acid ligase II